MIDVEPDGTLTKADDVAPPLDNDDAHRLTASLHGTADAADRVPLSGSLAPGRQ